MTDTMGTIPLARGGPAPPLPGDDLARIFEATSSFWEESRGKSFFITGGTGFFGSWLIESFCHANDALDLGATALLLSRDPDAFLLKSPHLRNRADVSFVTGDIASFDFPTTKVDFLIHAATDAAAGTGDEHRLMDAILAGTRRILSFAVQSGARNVLLTSSGAAYGTPPAETLHLEEVATPHPPHSGYGVAKLAAEGYATEHAILHGYDLKIARCFAFVGPHLPLDSVYAIGNFLRSALEGVPITIRGDGRTVRSYLYASDLAAWLWTILFTGRPGRIYNVGSPEDIDLARLAAVVNRVLENPAGTQILTPADHSTSPSRYVPSTARAQQELGLRALVPLDQAILKTARWHQSATPVPDS